MGDSIPDRLLAAASVWAESARALGQASTEPLHTVVMRAYYHAHDAGWRPCRRLDCESRKLVAGCGREAADLVYKLVDHHLHRKQVSVRRFGASILASAKLLGAQIESQVRDTICQAPAWARPVEQRRRKPFPRRKESDKFRFFCGRGDAQLQLVLEAFAALGIGKERVRSHTAVHTFGVGCCAEHDRREWNREGVCLDVDLLAPLTKRAVNRLLYAIGVPGARQ